MTDATAARTRTRAATLLLATAAACAAAQTRENPSALDIPRLDKPPAIDGVMAPGEWDRAAAIGGVLDQSGTIHVRPTTFYLGWDDDRLYLACRIWIMPGYKPRVSGREPMAASVGDDGLELHFQPLGKNRPTGKTTDSSYKFFVNALGFVGEPVRVSVGQLFRNWDQDFQAAAAMTEPDTAPKGGRWLTIEWSGSVGDFELDGPNRAGDPWLMMLGINHFPIWDQARIPANSGYFDPAGYTQARLAEGRPVAQMRQESMPGVCDGKAAAEVRVVNPGKAKADVAVEIRYTTGKDAETRELAALKKTVSVEPGQSADVAIDQAFAGEPVGGRGELSILATCGNETLLRYRAPFKTGYPDHFVRAKAPAEPFPLDAAFNPLRANLTLSGDRYYLPVPERAVAMTYVFRPKGGGPALIEGRIEEARNDAFRRFIELGAPLRPGDYTLEASLVLKDGSTLGPVTRNFRKLDEAKEFAEWWENDLGHVERVIPPFDAIRDRKAEIGGRKSAGRVFSCWGREYAIGALGLPVQAVSQGEALLAAPARIVVVVDGREQQVAMGRPRITESTDWRVRFEGKAEGAGLAFTATGWLEQDGMCYTEITYKPAGRKPVTVDALRIEWLFRSEAAECLLAYGPGGNYASRVNTVLPAGEGTLWTTHDLGKMASSMAEGSFFPLVWLGNERRGLLWWADNDKGWVPDDDVPAHEVARVSSDQLSVTSDQSSETAKSTDHGSPVTDHSLVLLRNNIIGKRFELSAKRTIRLSYMASPFKPLGKNWRTAFASFDGTFNGPHKDREDPKTGAKINGWNWLTPPGGTNEWSELWASYKKEADAKVLREQWSDPQRARNWYYVHTSLPLTGYGWKSPDWRVIGYFGGSEWGTHEGYVPSNIDYYLYLADRAFREGGLRTIYWDIFFVSPNTTLQNGLAYALPDGRVQPGFAGWNTRRFLMRMYALMHDRGLAPGGQVVHATGCYLLPAIAWVDALLEGEFHKLTDESTMDWVDGYPVDLMRSMANGHNWGTAFSWMNHIAVSGEKGARVRRGFVDYVRLFDSWTGPDNGRVPDDVLEWGINDERVEYVPFWRNPYVSGEDAEVLVSMWRLPDRVLLSVFNHNAKQAKTANLRIDLDALGLVPQLPWQEFVRMRALDKDVPANQNPSLNFHGRRLSVPAIAPRTARLIGIRLY